MERRIQAKRILGLGIILLLSAFFMLLGPALLLDQSHIRLFAFDTVVTVLALVVPIYAVLRFNWAGIIVGTVYLWLMPAAEGNVLSTYDRERGRILDSFWLYTGWIVGLIYCSVIYAVTLIITAMRNAKAIPPNSGET